MACNCSKRSTATGFARPAVSAQNAQREGAARQAYEHVDPQGKRTVLGSRLEASAARTRLGGTIRPA